MFFNAYDNQPLKYVRNFSANTGTSGTLKAVVRPAATTTKLCHSRTSSGRNEAMWAMRAKTFRHFLRKVLRPLEQRTNRPLDILDLGAGNCWLSYRLSLRGHRAIAVDIFADEEDGLGGAPHYAASFADRGERLRSHVPLLASSIDMAIFNASLHYSTDYVEHSGGNAALPSSRTGAGHSRFARLSRNENTENAW